RNWPKFLTTADVSVDAWAAALSLVQVPRDLRRLHWHLAVRIAEMAAWQGVQPPLMPRNPCWESALRGQRWQQVETLADSAKWMEACALCTHLAAGSCRLDLTHAQLASAAWQRSLGVLNSNPRQLGVLAASCAEQLQWAFTCRLLELMPSRRLEVRAAGYNAAVAACVHPGWAKSLLVAQQMSHARLTPDEISFGTLLCACPARSRAAYELLLSCEGRLWSPSFFPWACAKLGLRPPPWRLEAALRAAAAAPASRTADVAALAWAAVALGASGALFGAAIAAVKWRTCSHEELRILALAAAELAPSPRFWAELRGEVARRRRTGIWRTEGQDWKDLLGVVCALKSSVGLLEAEALPFEASLPVKPLTGEAPQVLLELPDLLVVHKPVGWEVYNDHGPKQLRDFLHAAGGAGRAPPIWRDASWDYGFLHRLDVPSSGLILAAKSYRGYRALQVQLATGRMQREYLVLSHGLAEASRGRVRALLWEAPITQVGLGRPALTKLKVLAHAFADGQAFSALAIQIATGRKHQIRSHVAHIGHPVVRDGRYASAATFRGDRRLCRGILHRWRLAFDAGGSRRVVEVPLPPELQLALARLLPKAGGLVPFRGSWEDLQPLRKKGTEKPVAAAADSVALKGDRRVARVLRVYARLQAVQSLAPCARRDSVSSSPVTVL
ncbi:unnamed protein product, partial [Effrenium voratum]